MKLSRAQIIEIRQEADYAFATRKTVRQMDDFERAVIWPVAKEAFALNSPEYVRRLLAHIEAMEGAK